MIVTTSWVDLPAAGGRMRTFVAAPETAGAYPGILFYSDIFQLTGPMLRSCVRLAGHGFVVAAPEIYHRTEPPGSAIPFDDAGRARGLENAAKTAAADFDADCRVALDYLKNHRWVSPARLGAAGFCIGGHLAFRAAMQPDVKATVCFYGTGIHNGRLGQDADAGSLQRVDEIRGKLLLVWGTLDPHIPAEGRAMVEETLKAAGRKFSNRLYPAEHAFMRDEGPRYDPEATDQAFGEMVRFYRETFPRGRDNVADLPGRLVTITSKLVGTVTVLHVSDRALTANEGDAGLRHTVRQAIDGGARAIVLNLHDVADIDSSGVADLASGHLTLTNRGGSLKLCHLSKKLKHIFAITRLNNVFEIYETEADAIASIKPA